MASVGAKSLLATVAAAREAGIDPEAALRRATLAYAGAVREAERAAATPAAGRAGGESGEAAG